MTTGPRPLSQWEVESQIAAALEALERETDAYAVLEDDASNAEADFKRSYATSVLRSAATYNADGKRLTGPVIEATADADSLTELRLFKIAEGRRRASKESLLSIRAKLDALRTLSANVRSQT